MDRATTIGIVLTIAAVAVLLYWVWQTWLKPTTATTTKPTTTPSTPTGTSANIVTTLDTTKLTTNLGYVEALGKIDVIAASPDAVKACSVIADTLWQDAIEAWKTAQTQPVASTTAPAIKTAKVTTTAGTVVEVPVQ